MRSKILSLLMAVIIILAVFYISIPNSTADNGTTTDQIEIQFSKIRRKEINVKEGEVEYSWKIIDQEKNFTGVGIDFRIETGDGFIEDVTNITEHSGKVSVDEGNYIFVWQNKNKNLNFTVKYSITYPQDTEEEHLGCYSGIFSLLIIFIFLTSSCAGFFKRKKRI